MLCALKIALNFDTMDLRELSKSMHAQADAERVRDAVDNMVDGLRAPGDGVPGLETGTGRERERTRKPVAEQQIGEDLEAALRRARGRVFFRHARAVDAIFKAQELHEARAAFNDLRRDGSRDAEAVYKRNPDFAADVASVDRERAILSTQDKQ